MLKIPVLIPMGAGNRSYLEIPRILPQQSRRLIPVFILERFLEIRKLSSSQVDIPFVPTRMDPAFTLIVRFIDKSHAGRDER